jgi:hypothetical protein
MGTSKSGADLAKKLTAVSKDLGRANRQAVSAAAMQYKDELLDNAERDLDSRNPSPKRSFSRWGKDNKGMAGSRKALQVSAGYDLRGYTNAVAKLKARPQGPWKVLEYGAKPHPIVPGASRAMRKQAAFVSAFTGAEVGAGALSGRVSSLGRSGRRYLKIPGSPTGFAAYAQSPGSKAKKTWSRSLAKRTPGAMRVFKSSHQRSLLRALSR